MRILYIDIDSCRADHLGCYGYHRNTSPNIDRLAKEGLLCRNYYCSDAPCLPSRTAFYSGRFGIQTGVVGHGMTAANPKIQGPSRGFRDWFDEQGLARQLQKAGFHTAMISPFGQRHAAHWFYAGFMEIHNTGKGGMESAEEVMPVVKKWFADNAAKDQWFLHINFWDPHTPFRAPASYGNPFEKDPLPPHLDDDALIARHRRKTGPHSAQDLGMYKPGDPRRWPREVAEIKDRATMKQWIDGYDTGIRYVDDQIGWIVEQLKKAGVYEDTAIIISADHGENQGELGIYSEHGTADRGTCHIPMVIKFPGGVKGQVDDRLHYGLDLAPTLMELLQLPKCEIWDGQSYARTVQTGQAAGRDQLVLSQCCHVCQRSVRWNDGGKQWLYMRTYHDGFHLFPQEMLYELGSDPFEQVDVAKQNPEVCKEGAWRLAQWHDAQMQKMALTCTDVVDPLWTVIREGGPFHAMHVDMPASPGSPGPGQKSPLADYIPRLEATGRAEGAMALKQKYARYWR